MKQFIRYMFFGVTTTLVNLGVLFVFKQSGFTNTDYGYTLANAIAWAASVICAYITNRIWVFDSKNKGTVRIAIEALKFFLGRVFTGLFEIFLPTPVSHWFEEGLTIRIMNRELYFDNQWIAKILVCILVILMNYFISKLLVFRNKK